VRRTQTVEQPGPWYFGLQKKLLDTPLDVLQASTGLSRHNAGAGAAREFHSPEIITITQEFRSKHAHSEMIPWNSRAKWADWSTIQPHAMVSSDLKLVDRQCMI
jgi:hypothetical protein